MLFREELILRITLVLGPQARRVVCSPPVRRYGLRLRLDEDTIDGQLFPKLKTQGSKGFLALPASLRAGLAEWREISEPSSDRQFIFPDADGGVFRLDNYRLTSSNRP